jgi:signal transduction histidine kinase/CheY-like chemotaxis protein
MEGIGTLKGVAMHFPSLAALGPSRSAGASAAIVTLLTFLLTASAGMLFLQKERREANALAALQQAHFHSDRVNHSLQRLSQRITEIATNPIVTGDLPDSRLNASYIEALLHGYLRIADIEVQMMVVDATGKRIADNGLANFTQKELEFFRLQRASGESSATIRDDVNGAILLGTEIVRNAKNGGSGGALFYKFRVADLQPGPANPLHWGLHKDDAPEGHVALHAPKRFDHLGFDVHVIPVAAEPVNMPLVFVWSMGVAALVGFVTLLLVRLVARGVAMDFHALERLAGSASPESALEQPMPAMRTAEGSELAEAVRRMLSRLATEAAETRAKLEQLIQMSHAIPQLVWITDANGKMRWMNNRWHAYVGSDSNDREANRQDWHQYIEPESLQTLMARWETMQKDGKMDQYPVQLRGADGQYRSFHTTIAPFMDERGVITHWIGTHTALPEDAGQIGPVHALLHKKNAVLKRMNHKIRTPIMTLSGATELAMRMKPDESLKKYFDRINAASAQIVAILDEGLDLCEVEDGNAIVLDDEPFDLPAEIRNAWDRFAADTSQRGLEFKLSIPEDIPAGVRGDATRIRQVLVHLINNAVQHTQKGHIAVNVSVLGPQDDRNDDAVKLLFEVEDSGTGIEPLQLKRLLAPAAAPEGSLATSTARHGLGLEYCKQVLGQMGGAIGADSKPGEGSRFWFTLSLRRESKLPGSPASHRGESSLAGIRILLAEDNRFNQEIAQVFLEESGATVVLAENGAQALLYLQRSRVDCVLMDMQMPDMDGLDATRRIRQNPAWKDLPVIAMTGNTSADNRRLCHEAGMNDFIAKPFSPEALLSAIVTQVKGTAPQSLPLKREGKTEAERLPRLPGVDLNALAAMVGNDPEKLRFLVSLFIDTTQNAIDELNAGVAAKDLTQLAHLGHRYKSSAKAVGASELSELFAALEDVHGFEEFVSRSDRGSDAKATALMTDVALQFDTVRKAVVEWMDESRKDEK